MSICLNFRLLTLIFVILIFTFFFIAIKETFAATTYTDTFYTFPPTSHTECSDRSGCSAPDTCWNSERAGTTNCGTACPGGDAWTKYQYIGCYRTFYDPNEGVERCERAHVESGDVCSTADKCDDGSGNRIGPYLRAGACNCSIGNTYKTCCTNSSPSYVSGGSCVQVSGDTTNPPWEGVCPAGTSSVQCGFGGLPSCGQEACGPLPPPPPPPPPPGSGCNCPYIEDCTTSDGRAGTWWCGGVKEGNVCKWDDSGACQPDCGTCIASAEGGSTCGNNACEPGKGETCSNCPDCRSCYTNITPSRGPCWTMPSSKKGMRIYVDPGTVKQGDVFTVTGTGEINCRDNIRLNKLNNFAASCHPVPGKFAICDRNNPKDSRACWWQWDCRTETSPGTYTVEIQANNYDWVCEDPDVGCRSEERNNVTVTAAGRIKGSIFVDSNTNGILDSGEKIIRETTTPCSGAQFQTDDSFSITVSGPASMTLEPRLCNTASIDPDQQVPYFDTGLILPTGGYTVRLNYNTSLWTSTNGDVRNITLNPTLSQQRTLFGVKPPLPPVPLPVTKPACSDTTYSATLNWQNTNNVLWADVDPDGDWGNKFYNKDVSNQTSTSAPAGFNGAVGLSGPMPNFNPNQTYFWRLWNGSTHTYGGGWTVPLCMTAWIQTIGGDVHSNGRIDLGGGP